MSLVLAALGPLVASWSLGGTARAAEESEVVDTVSTQLATVGEEALVVCARGEDGEKAAQRMLAGLEPAVTIVRIPVLGDIQAEAERVRTERAATCAVWLSQGTTTPWEFGVLGPCTPPEPEPSVGPVVAADMDADPDEAAPQPPPQHTVVLPPRLTVAELSPDPDDLDGVRWHVVDERGISWSTHRFAQTMGDTEVVMGLEGDLNRARKERKILMWTGIAGMAVSPLPLLYTETGAYGKNSDLAWTSLFLLASGGMTFALHKVGEQSEKKRQLRPALYYDRADTDALVSAYNARIDARAEQLEAEQARLEAEQAAQDAALDAGGADVPVDAPAEDAPAEDAPEEGAAAPADEAPAEDAPAEDVPAEDTPDEGAAAPADEAPVEEAPADEAPAAPADEAPPEADAPAESEAPAEDAPAPEPAPAPEAPPEPPPAEPPAAPEAPATDAPAGGAQ